MDHNISSSSAAANFFLFLIWFWFIYIFIGVTLYISWFLYCLLLPYVDLFIYYCLCLCSVACFDFHGQGWLSSGPGSMICGWSRDDMVFSLSGTGTLNWIHVGLGAVNIMGSYAPVFCLSVCACVARFWETVFLKLFSGTRSSHWDRGNFFSFFLQGSCS